MIIAKTSNQLIERTMVILERHHAPRLRVSNASKKSQRIRFNLNEEEQTPTDTPVKANTVLERGQYHYDDEKVFNFLVN